MTKSKSRASIRFIGIGAAAVAIIAVFTLLMAWLFGAFHAKVESAPAAAAERAGRPAEGVPLVEVTMRRVPRIESAVGTIRAVYESAVASKLLARVEEVLVGAGQAVTRGDVLVRLDEEDLQARLRQSEASENAARARAEQTRFVLERATTALAQGAATQLEVDDARAGHNAALAEVQRAEQTTREASTIVAYATVIAPMTGIIIDKEVDAGDTVMPGQILVTLYDPTRLQLVASVRESLTQRLTVGQDVDVTIEALGRTCTGQVSEIVPQSAAATRAFDVKVTGACPPGVYSGMFGRLLIPLDDEEVVLVPRAAVRRVGQLDIVDVADGDRLLRRAVELGRAFGDEVEVLAGLRPGERVALAPGTDAPGTERTGSASTIGPRSGSLG